MVVAVLGGGCRTGSKHGEAQPSVPRDAARIVGDAGALEVSEDGQTWRKGEAGAVLFAGHWFRSGTAAADLALGGGALRLRILPDTIVRLTELDTRGGLSPRLELKQGRLLTEARTGDAPVEPIISTPVSICGNPARDRVARWETSANGEVRVLAGVVAVIVLPPPSGVIHDEFWPVRKGEMLLFLPQDPPRQLTNCPPAILRRLRHEFRDMARVPR